MFSSSGTMATIASTRGIGSPSARPTSRIAARAASVPNVPIWATFSAPYFSLTYWMHLAAALLAEVDVDIGRFEAVLVEEPLEQQIVLQRADVAQVQRVADQRADARAAGRGRDALRPGEADEVPDDQEVVGEAELVDDVQLAVEPGDDLVGELAVGPAAAARRRSAPSDPCRQSSRR